MHPLPGGITNSGQPLSMTRSHESSWLPRRVTTLAGVLRAVSLERARTWRTTPAESGPLST